ncbi:MAG TPA: dienelactone hydrolase family protein [Segeticoccus sp.]|uniref:dienelactone hydrolase family protein n=1 Tax=Segeticoccus sp. TaxID=2706531 RepID=UPI002D809E8E|nr:dienelactone hydrolase family protein [Segeticoccus sp.]HET8598824.1 dienelactone hydrolase family protein [Segeticoccus sp.]
MQQVRIEAGPGLVLSADLVVPQRAEGVVVFAHGSGSSRFSPRNRQVAQALREQRMATLLADLLSPTEEQEDDRTALLRFDIGLLAARVSCLVDWCTRHTELARLPLGLFGASTGAAAALVSAADRPEAVRAVVSRGGRPDLAGPALERATAPTLLLVGGADEVVLGLNRDAAARLAAEHQLHVVPGATHLFEEPGALAEVAREAARWFTGHLPDST